ncbi:MAG: hypothetical protein ACR2N3_13310 [Pyrinomonadaceae bacterium]
MNKKVAYSCIGAIILTAAYLGVVNYTHNPDRVLDRFNQQLREEKFAEIYDESDSSVKNNVTKEEFIRRMTNVIGKLKEIDPDLNFQTDVWAEQSTSPANAYGRLHRTTELNNGKVGVNLLIWWNSNELFPKFTDMTVISETDGSEKYATAGVSYKNITYENIDGKKSINYHY